MQALAFTSAAKTTAWLTLVASASGTMMIIAARLHASKVRASALALSQTSAGPTRIASGTSEWLFLMAFTPCKWCSSPWCLLLTLRALLLMASVLLTHCCLPPPAPWNCRADDRCETRTHVSRKETDSPAARRSQGLTSSSLPFLPNSPATLTPISHQTTPAF